MRRACLCLAASAWLWRCNGAPPTPVVVYQGGEILTGPEIAIVFWGNGVPTALQANLPLFYAEITTSTDYDWLSEYDTPSQKVGRASLLGTFTIAPSNTQSTLADTDIEAELAAQIASGGLPAVTDNRYYAVYFPAGLQILSGPTQDVGCRDWKAYHGTLDAGVPPTYAAFPTCDACYTEECPAPRFAVHELFETMTDPYLTGWRTEDLSEIADLCESVISDIFLPDGGSLSVQGLWSDHWKRCLISGNEFEVTVLPETMSSSGPEAQFQVQLSGPGADAGDLSFTVSNLPAGVTYAVTAEDGGAPARSLRLQADASLPSFTFEVEVRSEFWRSTGHASVQAGAQGGGGCSQAGGGAPSGWLPLVVVLLGLTRIGPRSGGASGGGDLDQGVERGLPGGEGEDVHRVVGDDGCAGGEPVEPLPAVAHPDRALRDVGGDVSRRQELSAGVGETDRGAVGDAAPAGVGG